jgi:HD-GYP domain-containing protein (c-di-GMP phosphodiesterase class II)
MGLISRHELELLPLLPDTTLAATHTGGIRQMELAAVLSLARAIETRDPFTGSHIERVRRYSVEIARVLDLSDADVWRIGVGAVLHDVGKIGVPDALLNKRGPLTPRETEEMRRHPMIGARLLGDNPALEPARASVLTHHERWDGSGYPRGLSRHSIPLDGRIVAVADAFDAMTADRPYRFGLALERALDEIAAGSGTQFDPEIVRAFWSIPALDSLRHGRDPHADADKSPGLRPISHAAA